MGEQVCDTIYILDQKLGVGAAGVVYKVYNKKLNKGTAIKINRIINYYDGDDFIDKEIKALKKLNEYQIKNVPEYISSGKCTIGNLVNEKYVEMSLGDITFKDFYNNGNLFSQKQLYSLLFEIFYTMMQLIKYSCVHHDIKDDNIMIMYSQKPRIYKLMNTSIVIDELLGFMFIDFNLSLFECDQEYHSTDLTMLESVIEQMLYHTENVNEQNINNIEKIFEIFYNGDYNQINNELILLGDMIKNFQD